MTILLARSYVNILVHDIASFSFSRLRRPRHGGFVTVFDRFRGVFVDCCVMTAVACVLVAVMLLFSCFRALLDVFCARVLFVVVVAMTVFSYFVLFPCVFVDCCFTYDNIPYTGHDSVALTHHGSFEDMLCTREVHERNVSKKSSSCLHQLKTRRTWYIFYALKNFSRLTKTGEFVNFGHL